jgi:hypothetical protein
VSDVNTIVIYRAAVEILVSLGGWSGYLAKVFGFSDVEKDTSRQY